MKFEAFKKKIEVVTDSGTYILGMPSILQLSQLAESVKVADGSEQGVIKAHLEFLESLGLPKAEAEKLDAATFTSLVKFLTTVDDGQKKV